MSAACCGLLNWSKRGPNMSLLINSTVVWRSARWKID
jgi:hypothetical protein